TRHGYTNSFSYSFYVERRTYAIIDGRMMDPLISLAFSVYEHKGGYALFLGSGVSRAAGIPTGWEIVTDLIRKVAQLTGQNCEPDPSKWYLTKYKQPPDYRNLIEELAPSVIDRRQLLKPYFEPTDDEREQGLKLPTIAHRAIARAIADGFFRVI